MKTKHAVVLLIALGVGLAGCSKSSAPSSMKFTATLSGGEEVPPVTTQATGEAVFLLSSSGKELNYKLTVQNLDSVTMAHLHMAPKGQNGDIVVWLYPNAPPPKPIDHVVSGTLAEGSIDASRLMGPLQGKQVSDLVEKIKAGEIYVNVHTRQHPEGELRGQVHQQGMGS